jgi:hypothetical protein
VGDTPHDVEATKAAGAVSGPWRTCSQAFEGLSDRVVDTPGQRARSSAVCKCWRLRERNPRWRGDNNCIALALAARCVEIHDD